MLIAILSVETFLGVLALIPLALGFFGSGGEQLGQRVSVLLAGLLAVLWVVVTCLGALRGRASWARGSALTIHVLLFAAGTGILQYGLAETWVGWAAILTALAGFAAAVVARPDGHEASERDHGTGGDTESGGGDGSDPAVTRLGS